MKKIRFPIIRTSLALMLAFTSTALPYSYNGWTGMTGAGTLAINPFIYGGISPFSGLSMDPVISAGISAKFDILANPATVNFYDPISYGGSWLMPRFDIGGNSIIALQAGYNTSVFYLTPQYHLFKDMERWAFELNAGISIPLAQSAVLTVYAVIAPVFKATKVLAFFLEVDPSFYFGSGSGTFGLNLVPGLCLSFDASNQLSMGVILGGVTSGALTPGIGIWYWHPFNL